MALQTSPPISIKDIYREFGCPDGTPLTDLVRGGAWVQNSTVNAGIPTAPPISVMNFLGASRAVSSVDLRVAFVGAPSDELSVGRAGLQVSTDGNVYAMVNGSTSLYWKWLLAGVAAEHEIMFTHASTPVGFLSTMSPGVWYPINTMRSMNVNGQFGNPGKPGREGVADLDVRIRHPSLGITYGPVRWSLQADGAYG